MNDLYLEPGGRVERFVRRENIARFGQMLAAAQDESERKILMELIEREKDGQRKAGNLQAAGSLDSDSNDGRAATGAGR